MCVTEPCKHSYYITLITKVFSVTRQYKAITTVYTYMYEPLHVRKLDVNHGTKKLHACQKPKQHSVDQWPSTCRLKHVHLLVHPVDH